MSQALVAALPSEAEEYWGWQLEAACRELGTSMFFAPEGERGPRKERREQRAKQVCGTCAVRRVCAAYALAVQEPYGTWGGMGEGERRELLRTLDPRSARRGYRQALLDWATGSEGRATAEPVSP